MCFMDNHQKNPTEAGCVTGLIKIRQGKAI